MEHLALQYLGAGLAMIAAWGAATALGSIFSTWISSIARNPAVAPKLFTVGIIGFAATELVLLLCFVVAFLLLSK